MEEDIEFWMEANSIKRIGRLSARHGGAWVVYLDEADGFGTGATLEEAVNDARGRA